MAQNFDTQVVVFEIQSKLIPRASKKPISCWNT